MLIFPNFFSFCSAVFCICFYSLPRSFRKSASICALLRVFFAIFFIMSQFKIYKEPAVLQSWFSFYTSMYGDNRLECWAHVDFQEFDQHFEFNLDFCNFHCRQREWIKFSTEIPSIRQMFTKSWQRHMLFWFIF